MKNKKLIILRTILILMLFAMFYIIFGFSNQNGEQSGSISRKITYLITKNIKSIQKMQDEEKEIKLKQIEHMVRKLAHFSLYTSVGFLTMSLMSTYRLKLFIKVISSLILGSIYAFLDEIHQSFIPGRVASIKDIGIDTLGVIFGIVLVICIIKILKKIKKL